MSTLLLQVEPKNLGVGLYQHDIPPKMLESGLDIAVENIVSLVGVDLNTASQAMLRYLYLYIKLDFQLNSVKKLISL